MPKFSPRILHIISCIVFLIFAIITLRSFLVGDALFNYRDDIWSTNLGSVISDAVNTFNIEATRRLIYLAPFLALGDILGHSSLLAEKSLFLFTRFIIGFLPYIATYKFLSAKFDTTISKNKIFIISLFAGFFYAYNPFVTEKMGAGVHGFPVSYALIPLIFYYFDKALNEKGFYNVLITSILISIAIAATMQYIVWLPLFLLVPWLGMVVIKRISLKKPIWNAIRNSLLILFFFTLISFYWILMGISISIVSGVPKPAYVITESMLNSLSSTTSLLNVVRLMGIWWPYVELNPIIDQSLWIFLTFVIPIGVVSSLLYLANRQSILKFYTVSFFLILLFILFFYKGIQPPDGWFYSLLVYVPVIGWMFRAPESNGMFLPFFVMMILSFSFYNLLKPSKTKINSLLKIIPILVFITSIAVLSWPMFTGDLGGIYKGEKIQKGISNIIAEDKNLSVSKETIAIIGGSDKADSLNDSGLIDPKLSSLFFSDNMNMHATSANDSAVNGIISDDGSGSFIHFLDENSSVLAPFDATMVHNPDLVWSKARTYDPLNGQFHEYLDQFRMTNKDFDYGKGLVLTWAQDKLNIPLQPKADGLYDLYIRYMQNPVGGKLTIYLNNYEIKEISTADQLTKFVWQNIGTYNLTKGKYTLTLENTYGFNAVNILTLIPSLSNSKLLEQADTYVNNKRVIYVLDGNSSFYNINHEISEHNIIANKSTGTFDKVPINGTQLSLQFYPDWTNYYQINGLEITPILNQSIFASGFETPEDFEKWNNNNPNFQYISSETINPISGNKSLRVDVAKADRGIFWNVINLTELIPVAENVNVNYQFSVSSLDEDQLNAKVYYYDEKKNFINVAYLGELGPNGRFSKSHITPEGTKYINLQFWFRTNPEKASIFLIDDIKITQTTNLPSYTFQDIFQNPNSEYPQLILNTESMKVDGVKIAEIGKTTQSLPIPVNENVIYNYKTNAKGENLDSFDGKVVYSSSDIKNDRHVIYVGKLLPHSETFRNIRILKPSNYTIATQATTCSDCTYLVVKVGDTVKKLSLRNDHTVDKWFYFTTHLNAGNTEVKIYSDGQTSLYKMILYSDSHENETLNDLFKPKETPAVLLDSKKIDSTHYQARVNATKPFLLKLTGPYQPGWLAYASGRQYNSVELYPDANGFFINQTGEFTIKIQYLSQKWFYIGSLVTIFTLTGIIFYLTWQRRKKVKFLLYRSVISKNESLSYYLKLADDTRELNKSTESTEQITQSIHRDMGEDTSPPRLGHDSESIKYIGESRVKLILRSILKAEFPIFISLAILVLLPFLLILQQAYFAADLMTYVYKLLVVGAVWQFIQYLKSNRETSSKRTYYF